MSSRFPDAARRMSGQFAEAAHELSWPARYTRDPGGLWARRRWRVGWDNVVHPRRMGALEAEEWLWNGLLGDALAEVEELRRALGQAQERLHELTPGPDERSSCGPVAEEEAALDPDMTEAGIQRMPVVRTDPEFEAGQ